MTEVPAPWDQQPGETARAYQAFCIYRDMPPGERSLLKVAIALGYVRAEKGGRRPNVPGRIQEWSKRWRWVERAKAWDQEQDRRNREAQLKARQEMLERHAREAMALQQKALQRLKDMDPNELSPEAVLRYFVEAAKLERISRGEPETVEEQRHDVTGYAAALLSVWERRRKRQEEAGPDADRVESAS